MRISVIRDRLISIFKKVNLIINSNYCYEFFMEANELGLTFIIRHHRTILRYTIPVRVGNKELVYVWQPGSIEIYYFNWIKDILEKLPEKWIDINVNETHIIFHSGSTTCEVRGAVSKKYFEYNCEVSKILFVISSKNLLSLIQQSIYAASTSEIRPILQGLKWSLSNNQLQSLSTDSHRLSLCTKNVEFQSSNSVSIVVPGKSLNHLAKILEETDELITVKLSCNNEAIITGYNWMFITPLIEGDFPDVSHVIPKTFTTKAIVRTRTLLTALERVMAISKEKNHKITLQVSNQTIKISLRKKEFVYIDEIVYPLTIEGNDTKISVNIKYMVDALRAINSLKC